MKPLERLRKSGIEELRTEQIRGSQTSCSTIWTLMTWSILSITVVQRRKTSRSKAVPQKLRLPMAPNRLENSLRWILQSLLNNMSNLLGSSRPIKFRKISHLKKERLQVMKMPPTWLPGHLCSLVNRSETVIARQKEQWKWPKELWQRLLGRMKLSKRKMRLHRKTLQPMSSNLSSLVVQWLPSIMIPMLKRPLTPNSRNSKRTSTWKQFPSLEIRWNQTCLINGS